MKKVDSLLIEDLIAGIAADEEVDDPLLDRPQREAGEGAAPADDGLEELPLPLVVRSISTRSARVAGSAEDAPEHHLAQRSLGDQQNKELRRDGPRRCLRMDAPPARRRASCGPLLTRSSTCR